MELSHSFFSPLLSCGSSYLLLLCALFFTAGSNGHVTYGGVTEDGFIINPMTGVITTTKELDAEFQTHYTLTGTAGKNAHRNAQYPKLAQAPTHLIHSTLSDSYQCSLGTVACLPTSPKPWSVWRCRM